MSVQDLTPAATRGQTLLPALGMVVLWALGAMLARGLGIWVAVGTTAMVLGCVSLVMRRDLLADRAALGSGIGYGVAAGLVMAAGTHVLYGPVTRALPWLVADIDALYRAFAGPGRMVAALLMPVVVIAEEFVWRGVVYSALADRLGRVPAVLGGTLLYAVAQAPIGSAALLMACLGAGLCWTALRAVTGQLSVAVVAHVVWDLAVLIVWPPGA